jgi:hypothetical protein
MDAGAPIACRKLTVASGGWWGATSALAGWVGGRPGQLRIARDAIHIEQHGRQPLAIARAQIRAGFRLPGSGAVILLLHDGGRVTLEAEVDVLGALDLDVAGPPLDVRLHRLGDAITFGVLLWFYGVFFAGGVSAALGNPLPFAAWSACAVAVMIVMALRRIVIGADGVLVRSGLRERFIPFKDVERIEDLCIITTRGRRLKVAVSGKPTERAAAVHRLQHAFHGYKTRMREADARLARGDRDLGAWVEDLKRQARDPGSFRRAGTSPEALERIVVNPASGVEQRLGAAIALSSLGEDSAKRVRIAAQASVNEELRVALEAAAEGEIDESVYEAAVRHERR